MKTLCIIRATEQSAANELARQMQAEVDGDGGQRSFTVPLFSNQTADDSTPVAYWCAVNFTPDIKAQAEAALSQFPGALLDDYDPVNDHGFPDRKLTGLGLRRAKAVLP